MQYKACIKDFVTETLPDSPSCKSNQAFNQRRYTSEKEDVSQVTDREWCASGQGSITSLMDSKTCGPSSAEAAADPDCS